MKRIIKTQEMSRADKEAVEMGLPSLVLMERAALSVVEEILSRDIDLSDILIVCGTGNNAGDGAAAARIFAERGIETDILLIGDTSKRSEQLKTQIQVLDSYGFNEVSEIEKGKYTLIIDALFGIGLSRNIEGRYADIIESINAEDAYKVSVDIASGIEGNSGAVLGTAVKADLTVTFARAKTGQYIYPGAEYSGEVVVKEIGIPVIEKEGDSKIYSVEENDIFMLPARNEYGNKSTFGKLLVIAGSEKICGAAFFASMAALKSGIGMVKILTEENNRTALATLIPEALIDTYGKNGIEKDELIACLDWADAVVIGPGIGTDANSERLFDIFAECNKLPTVIDADALNIISKNNSMWNKISFQGVITPHIGEMSRLTGMCISEIKRDPIGTAMDFSASHNVVCVLKDAVTVTAYPDGRCFINTSGCSGLSTAGSGDVLSGIIGGLIARFKSCELPLEAFGVFIHGRLGEYASSLSNESAVVASDLIKALDDQKFL